MGFVLNITVESSNRIWLCVRLVHVCRCKCEWHKGMTCEDCKNTEEDEETLKLAAEHNWKKCPKCGYV